MEFRPCGGTGVISAISVAMQIAASFIPSLVIYLLATVCRNPVSKSILQKLAIGSAVFLALLFMFLGGAAIACSGNAIYGYGDCTVVHERLANLSIIILVLSVAALSCIALTFLGIAGVTEWKFRRNAKS